MAHVEINVEDGKGSIVVDGHDWTTLVLAEGFTVDLNGGHPIVSLRIGAESLKLSLNGAAVTVSETELA